ncbi:NAD(P)H-binding protein [Pendulispora albinea]|uniref:NAD(P)H-binding protein n=1 Tax=Pendulispora albinea TaxID=2741071 RepID=A0ABZ2M7A6_9BACT
MTIALTAPTGKVGTALLTQAQGLRLPIRPLARRGEIPFDFTDPATYARALDGARTLVLVSPPLRDQDTRDVAVIDAAREAGVTHVVKLSGYRADEAMTRFAAQHRTGEERLRASSLAWTFVRPTFFMENNLALATSVTAGDYPAPLAGARITQVAVDDVAAVLLAVARAPEPHREAIYTLTAEAAHRGEDIARVLAEAAGHPVRYVDLSEDALRQDLHGAGHEPWNAEGILEAYRNVRAGGATMTTDDIRRVTGRAPIDFATWARRHAAAFRA